MTNFKNILNNIQDIEAICEASYAKEIETFEIEKLKELYEEVTATSKNIKRGDQIITLQFTIIINNNGYNFNLHINLPTELNEKEIEKIYEEPDLINNYDYDFIVINEKEGIQKWQGSRGGGHITFHHWESNLLTNVTCYI